MTDMGDNAESLRMRARLGYLNMFPRDRTLAQGRQPLINNLMNAGVYNINQNPGAYFMPGGNGQTLSSVRAYTVAGGVQNYALGSLPFATRVSYNP